ncbi:MAG: hypothetical protein IJG43_08300 [Acidaminococcaceae bacterium]|nr:hypothetical protein [Acidaminococcaceae bacterium]
MNEKQIIRLMKMPRTDAGNAQRLLELFGNTWKYLPQYRSWMHWDGHCWKGQTTADLRGAAANAFRQLAMDIYCLPVPQNDVAERIYRLKIIAWLYKSQIDYHVTLAVRYYKKLLWREEPAEEK